VTASRPRRGNASTPPPARRPARTEQRAPATAREGSGSAPARQTLSYLRDLFEARGIRPKSKLGQNFLIDLNLLDLIVRTAELTQDDVALEVGSGTGSLTAQLADHAGAVLSVEVDTAFYAMATEAVTGRPSVSLVHADILRTKNELNPEVLAALAGVRERSGCTRLKLVANLPYVVATPVISNLLLSELPVERMVVTVQWEIAARLMAEPGSKDYGALSVLVQSLADVELVRRLVPAVFWPRPQVDSAIVVVRPNAAKRAHVGDVLRFRHFLRDLYAHRRKNLRGALAGWPSGRREKHEVDEKLATLGLDGTVRAETLDAEQHLRLCAAFG
jgi:16S rRNA (adenine1518-N6/adenine1519-N6)-dimethyltransferase